jgi:serine/threonine-protein kinase HipA
LFVPRFDRDVTPAGVVRFAQESLASLCGVAEFGAAPTHNVAVAQIARAATTPEEEVTEYVMRDIANVVLGNKDNHARNTAIQRTEDGLVRLTPLFDFAPMLLHPDGISRRMRWERDDAGAPRWASVVAQCREITSLALPNLPARLRAMGERLDVLPERAREEGVDEPLLERLRSGIRDAADQLRAI